MSTKFGHNACNVKLIVNVISLLFFNSDIGLVWPACVCGKILDKTPWNWSSRLVTWTLSRTLSHGVCTVFSLASLAA